MYRTRSIELHLRRNFYRAAEAAGAAEAAEGAQIRLNALTMRIGEYNQILEQNKLRLVHAKQANESNKNMVALQTEQTKLARLLEENIKTFTQFVSDYVERVVPPHAQDDIYAEIVKALRKLKNEALKKTLIASFIGTGEGDQFVEI